MHSVVIPSTRALLAAILVLFAVLALILAPIRSASANPKYAAIVIDANTGKTLYSENADAPRYPASLTKMMTLYLVFEALESRRISKNTPVRFSSYAASKPPSKLGVKAGNTITVEAAIYALVTKSANDVAAAVGELLGGSESKFADLMTARAKQLGMKSTRFRNASGLPDGRQVTTARDMAILGVALREHFPNHYRYFSTRAFKFGGRTYANHNRLLGRIKGVDGIKTGYIRASGFNLVTSVVDGKRSIVAVVMGGRTGKSRNNHMAELVRRYLPKASTRSGGPLLAARKGLPGIALAALAPKDAPIPEPRPATERIEDLITGSTRAEEALEVAEGSTAEQELPEPEYGWVVQVASLPSETEAHAFLQRTKERAGTILAGVTGFTEVFEKDGTVYHRVRFGGFESGKSASQTCASLKKRKIACYAVAQ